VSQAQRSAGGPSPARAACQFQSERGFAIRSTPQTASASQSKISVFPPLETSWHGQIADHLLRTTSPHSKKSLAARFMRS